MPEIKKKSAFARAMKNTNQWTLSYAKFMCNLSNKGRLKIYRKLAALLRNRFSLMNSLDMIYNGLSDEGAHPNEPMAIAVSSWGRALQEGHPFSEALKGWAPSRERLMLSVGDVSDLESALMNLIKVSEGSSRMIRPIVSAIAYPAFLLMMSVLILYAIGVYMVPPMLSAAPGLVWTGTARSLVNLSEWIQKNWAIAFAILPVIGIIIYATIGIWSRGLRIRFDRYPPWSLYKIFTGITWLLALSALVKGGVPVSIALTSLRKDSSRYLRDRIDGALFHIKNGDNLGQALAKAKQEFPDKQIISDLKVYSELDNFEEALDKLANEWLEDSVYLIEQKSEIMNTVALLTVSGIIAWAVFATFDMQDQITSSM
ncbi:MAG: type II secretion system F family protein [Alphaproteobacteria bacterium]|nr:type II secretion system F family protein [Alphaproteobacteria bacterium]